MSFARKMMRQTKAPKLKGNWYLSDDGKRVVAEMEMGIGCYTGRMVGSKWVGGYKGKADSPQEAKRFLVGDPKDEPRLSKIIIDESKVFPDTFTIEIQKQ